jgi:hypothetical protein
MSERRSLFRQEALEFQAAEPRQGGVLRIDPPWTRWLYWIVLVSVAAGVVITATARTSETTSGPAVINVQARTFAALVPDAASRDLRRGQLVRLHVNGPNGRPLTARLLKTQVADQAAARRAGFASPSLPAMLVTGVLTPHADVTSLPSSARHEGRATVTLREQRILGLFLRQLRGIFGGGGDS